MRRREFIAGLGGVAAVPRTARSQQAMPVIGYFSGRSAATEAAVRAPFLAALAEAGFVPERNVVIEYQFSEGRDERLPALAADLVRRQVALLVATDRPSALAAKAATATIPIVFTTGDDPVQLGLAASLNKPGGNATGVHLFTTSLGPKRLGLLREFLVRPGLIAFVVNPVSGITPPQVEEIQAAAKALGQPLVVMEAGTPVEIDAAFAKMAQDGVKGVLFAAGLFFQVITDQLVALAARYKIPVCYEWREFAVAGGLMSYSTNRAEFGRQIGVYAAQILKGAKPADLPVVQASSFLFTINLKTAKALGFEVPPTLLARADEVVE